MTLDDLLPTEVRICVWPRESPRIMASLNRQPRFRQETWDEKILNCLAGSEDPLTAAQIAIHIQREARKVRMFLGQLKKRKVVMSRPKVAKRDHCGRPTHVWWML